MATKQAKKVSTTKTANNSNIDTETGKPVTLAKGPPTSKNGKSQFADKATSAMVAPAANDADQEAESVSILDKYVVPAELLDLVERQFCDIYPALLNDTTYTPMEIIGEVFWANLSNVGKRLSILCLKHLATEPDVPLVDLTCEDCGITNFAVV